MAEIIFACRLPRFVAAAVADDLESSRLGFAQPQT
jgi:hypothetical protein